MALGGPNNYTGRGMRAAHAKVNNGSHPTEEQFNAVAGHLAATLKEAGVTDDLINEVIGVVATTKNDVLGL